MADNNTPRTFTDADFEDDPTNLKPVKTSAARKLGDLAIGFGQGAVGATKALSDAFGANNAVSQGLEGVNKGLGSFLSAETKDRQFEADRLQQEAKGKGIAAEVAGFGKAFATDPAQMMAQGFGSIAPLALAQLIPGVGQSATAARALQAGMGLGMGAGTAKGAIHEEVQKRELAAGKTAEQAQAAADAAQAYGGENSDQIALGAGLGLADAVTGATPAAVRLLRQKLGKEVLEEGSKKASEGIFKAGAKGALAEMPVEFAQGGQEQLAANIAAQRAGYQADTWEGVVGKGGMEALASAGPGAAFGIAGRNRGADPQPQPDPNAPQAEGQPPIGPQGGVSFDSNATPALDARALEAAGVSMPPPAAVLDSGRIDRMVDLGTEQQPINASEQQGGPKNSDEDGYLGSSIAPISIGGQEAFIAQHPENVMRQMQGLEQNPRLNKIAASRQDAEHLIGDMWLGYGNKDNDKLVQDFLSNVNGSTYAEPLSEVPASKRMGLDASVGPLSAAAVTAVDSGASPAAAALASGVGGGFGIGRAARGEPVDVTPINQSAGQIGATKRLGETPIIDVEARWKDEGPRQGDMMAPNNAPFQSQALALQASQQTPQGGEVVAVPNGFVVRPQLLGIEQPTQAPRLGYDGERKGAATRLAERQPTAQAPQQPPEKYQSEPVRAPENRQNTVKPSAEPPRLGMTPAQQRDFVENPEYMDLEVLRNGEQSNAAKNTASKLPRGQFARLAINKKNSPYENSSKTTTHGAWVSDGNGGAKWVEEPTFESRKTPPSEKRIGELFGEAVKQESEKEQKKIQQVNARKEQFKNMGVAIGSELKGAQAYVAGKKGITTYSSAKVDSFDENGMAIIRATLRGSKHEYKLVVGPESSIFDGLRKTAPESRQQPPVRDGSTPIAMGMETYAGKDIPKAVKDKLKFAVSRLNSVKFTLDSVKKARGDGHHLATEVARQKDTYDKYASIIADFKQKAEKIGVNLSPFLAEIGDVSESVGAYFNKNIASTDGNKSVTPQKDVVNQAAGAFAQALAGGKSRDDAAKAAADVVISNTGGGGAAFASTKEAGKAVTAAVKQGLAQDTQRIATAPLPDGGMSDDALAQALGIDDGGNMGGASQKTVAPEDLYKAAGAVLGTPKPQGSERAPDAKAATTEATAQSKDVAPVFLESPPVEHYRLFYAQKFNEPPPVAHYRLKEYKSGYGKWSYVLPGVGKSYSDKDKKDLVSWFKSAGWESEIKEGRVLVRPKEGDSLDDIPMSPSEKAIFEKKREEYLKSQEIAAKKEAEIAALKNTVEYSFVNGLLGDNANSATKIALAKYLTGEKFEGIGGNWVFHLKDAGIDVGDGVQVAHALKGLSAAYKKQSSSTAEAAPAPVNARPANWRTNMISAAKVAKGVGISAKGKKLKDVVAEIDAADVAKAQPEKPVVAGVRQGAVPDEAPWSDAEEKRLMSLIGHNGSISYKEMDGNVVAKLIETDKDNKYASATGKTKLSAKRALLKKLSESKNPPQETEAGAPSSTQADNIAPLLNKLASGYGYSGGIDTMPAGLGKTARKLYEAMLSADVSAVQEILHLGNKRSRKAFESLFDGRVKLPKTVSGTNAIVADVLGKIAQGKEKASGTPPRAATDELISGLKENPNIKITDAEAIAEREAANFDSADAAKAKTQDEGQHDDTMDDPEMAAYERGLTATTRAADKQKVADAWNDKPAAKPAVSASPAAQSSSDDILDAELSDALGKLGDVLGDVFGAKLNATGQQYTAGDLLPALSKVVELLAKKGLKSFAQSTGKAAQLMRADPRTAAHVDSISPRQWKAAYNAIAEGFEGTDSEDTINAMKADEVLAIVAPKSITEQNPQKTENDNAALEKPSQKALGNVPTKNDSRPEGSRKAGASPASGGNQSGNSGAGVDGERVSTTRSGGGGASGVSDSATGAARAGRPRGDGTAGNGAGVPSTDGRLNTPETASAPNIPSANFAITPDLKLGTGGEVVKFNDNIAAIKTLKTLETERRRATPDEQRVLARFVGWGGLANAFPNPETGEFKSEWVKRGNELRDLLTPSEYRAASRSTRNAHYTSETVVGAMWDAARRLGYRNGLALESSMGSGNFLGLMPRDMAARFIGVEYDSITARLAGALYPQATVLHSGFQDVALPDGAFDLDIGNPPFGSESLRFQYKPELEGLSIHNQFFLAGIDALRPGGLKISVVSSFLMDAQDRSTRLALAKKANLVAAIRLPTTAFKENARTEVVTDIVILQRRTKEDERRVTEAVEMLTKPLSAKEQRDMSPLERQRRAELADEYRKELRWVTTSPVKDPLGGEPILVNSYFADNPNQIIGTMDRSGTMRTSGMMNVRLDDPATLGKRLGELVDKLPKDILSTAKDVAERTEEAYKLLGESLRISVARQEPGQVLFDEDGNLVRVVEREYGDGTLLQRQVLTPQSPFSSQLFLDSMGRWYKVDVRMDADGKPMKLVKDGKATKLNEYVRTNYEKESDIPESMRLGQLNYERMKDLAGMRDLLKRQLVLETEDAPKVMMEGNRKKLALAYKAYVDKHGPINRRSNAALLSEMPDGGLVLALESDYEPARTAEQAKRSGLPQQSETVKPAPIMRERVVPKYSPLTSASTPSDALAVSLAERGVVDMEHIAKLLNQSTEKAAAALTGGESPLVFKDPETNTFETANAYLSGQVRRKLMAAKSAGLEQNIKALESVQPERWGAEKVSVQIGATWVPSEVYADFAKHLMGGTASVHHSALTNTFSVKVHNEDRGKSDQWATERMSGVKILEKLLNSQTPNVMTKDMDGNLRLDKDATALAILKGREIVAEFDDWIFKDGDRRELLVDQFNEKFNTRVMRQYDGQHLTLPGKVPDTIIKMRRHQLNAIWRGISSRFMLVDHTVGAGKTFTAIARAMERRRMGLAKKPTVVVPNHLVEQWAADVYRLYPAAKVLAATKKDFEKSNRRRLLSRVATGDYDIVILPHSSFGFVGIAPETELRYLEEELKQALAAVGEAEKQAEDDGDVGFRKPLGVKEAERLVAKIESRMANLRNSARDRLLTFEQLGIDDLTIDEAHEFKNLFYSSRLTKVRGMGDKIGSRKAADLYNKVRVLRDSGGAITFMTGTPVSNSVVELYTMMRYLAPNELREMGMEHFDAWRAQFVDASPAFEPNESGRLQEVTRLGRTWSNMRNMMDLYYTFTDAVTNDDIKKWYREDNSGKEFPIPKVKGGDRQLRKVIPTEAQESYLKEIIAGFDGLPDIKDIQERNATRLRLMDRARKLSLDVRAALPGSTSKEKGGKLEQIASEVKRIYAKTTKDLGTQIVFLDRSVPKAKGDDKKIKEFDALIAKRDKALSDGDDIGFQKINETLEAYDSQEIEELRLAQSGGWNAYKQLKENMVALGIPADEIRFVQDANTDEQKQALFDAVNGGKVRVLIGSTPRMGAGTNVQQRLVGLHHADVTWKPSDIEQREGRIIRQGNLFATPPTADKPNPLYRADFEVEILAYATERTVDAKMWSLNATKLKAINGLRKYTGDFTMELEDEESVSMAEMAALASGNPLLLERVTLESDIQKLELQERSHRRKVHGAEDEVKRAKNIIETYPERIKNARELAEYMIPRANELSNRASSRVVSIDGKQFKSYFDAMREVANSITAQQAGNEYARYVVDVNGNRLTSKNAIDEAVGDGLGDSEPFEVEIQGKTFTRRTSAGRELAEVLSPKAALMSDRGTLGSMLGLDLKYDVSKRENGRIDMELWLERNGKTVASDGRWGHDPYQKFTTSQMRDLIGNIAKSAMNSAHHGAGDWFEEKLNEARSNIQRLVEQTKEAFPNAQELKDKRQRLKDVVATLTSDSPKPTQDDTLKMSRGGGAALPPTITVDGVERPTTNSNGQQIAVTEEGVRNFWRWFGDSQQTDSDNQPIVYHHYGNRRIEKLGGGNFGGGLFVLENQNYASGYGSIHTEIYLAGEIAGSRDLENYLDDLPDGGAEFFSQFLRHGVDSNLDEDQVEAFRDVVIGEGGFDEDGVFEQLTGETELSDAFIMMQEIRGKLAKVAGFSAVHMEDEFSGKAIMVVAPDKIKSATGNQGTFDPNDADIRKSSSESLTQSKAIPRTPAANIRKALEKAYGKLFARLESKGLVTLAQTEQEAIEAAAKARAEKLGTDYQQELDGLMAAVSASRVWHGTAQKGIKQFSTRFLLKGEGANFFGAGLYFTESEDIAEWYRQELSADPSKVFTANEMMPVTIDGKQVSDGDAANAIKRLALLVSKPESKRLTDEYALAYFSYAASQSADAEINQKGTFRAYFIEDRQGEAWAAPIKHSPSEAEWDFLESWLKKNEKRFGYRKADGQVYEVEIPEDEAMLLWDKPIGEQSAFVFKALRKSGFSFKFSDTGKDFYENAVISLSGAEGRLHGPSQAAVSLALRKQGIKGIKYPAGTVTKKGGIGLSNYVIFDGADTKIVDVKYSSSGLIQGLFDPATKHAYMVADALFEDTAGGVLMHEVGIHMAASGGKLAPLVNRAAFMVKNAKGAFFDDVRQKMAKAREKSAEEAAAYLVEAYENSRDSAPSAVKQWFKDFMAAVRAWLFRAGRGLVLRADQLTAADIAAVARANAKRFARGGVGGGSGQFLNRSFDGRVEATAENIQSIDDEAMFSRQRAQRAFSPAAKKQAIDAVQSQVSGIKAAWKNAPDVVVAFDMNDPVIPEAVRKKDQAQRSSDAGGAPEGFYYQGKVYLMASKLPTARDTTRVLFHEALGHHGLRGVFGESLHLLLRQIVTMRKQEIKAKIEDYKRRGVKHISPLVAAEEMLAEMAENAPDVGFARHAIAAIKQWLKDNIPGFDGMKFTDDDIVSLFIVPARRFVEGGNGPNGGGGVDSGIRFSRTGGNGQPPTGAVPNYFDVKDAGGRAKEGMADRLADWRGLSMQALGRRQIVDLWGKLLPQLGRYDDLVQKMDAEKNATAAGADELATAWAELDGKGFLGLGKAKNAGMEAKLAELMHDATLGGVDADPSVPLPNDATVAQKMAKGAFTKRFDALTPDAQAVYRKVRDIYADQNKAIRKALTERIERAAELSPDSKRTMIAQMDADMMWEKRGVYFPLSRFGKYVVVVKDASGKTMSVSRAETLPESKKLRAELQSRYPSDQGFHVSKVYLDHEFNAARDAVGKGFMGDLVQTLRNEGMDEGVIDSVGQLYLKSLPDLSWAKHGIHRKGTPGFSQDARRAFAQNMIHGASHLAKLRYADRLQMELTDMQAYIKDNQDDDGFDNVKAVQVYDEMVKRHDLLMSPKTHPLSTALTSAGFLFYLGLSPASAAVNLSQTALLAYPIMGAKWGYDKAGAALLKASAEVAKAKNDYRSVLQGDELKALTQAIDDGTIDVTMVHDLAGIAGGEDQRVTWAMRPVMRAASFMFHHAEKFNRQATFIAAYRLARENPLTTHDQAFAEARKATYDGHFDYSAANRPRVMQGNWAKVLLLFKQYGQNMIYTLARQTYLSIKGDTPEQKREARKAISGILALHAFAAGVLGLPVVGTLLALASAMGGDDDEPWDAKVAIQNALAESLGQKPAEVLAHGLSRLTPWDMSGRVALNSLILPDVQEGLEGQRLAESAMTAALGPVAGIGVGFARGVQKMSQGDYARGFEDMLPVVLRNQLKAMRYATEGNVDKTGVVINDEVSAAGVAGQALGFAPSETRLAAEGKQAIYQADKRLSERRAQLMRLYSMAKMADDDEGVTEAREAIARFNAKNPDRKITVIQLAQSVKSRQKRIAEAQQGVYLPENRRGALDAGRFAVTAE